MRTMKLSALILGVILVLSTAAAASDVYGTAVDPSYIGVGARPLGMGKAYVALAEDATSIFVNPAGLARVNEVLFSSMYSNLMQDINYTVGSITYPLGSGTVALGYLGVTVPGIELYTGDDIPVSAGKTDYSNYVLYASYGQRLDTINPDLMVGVNVKSFSEGYSGSDLTANGAGTGMNFDLGLLYQPNNWFTVGLTQQNILEAGKMQFEGGLQENLPSLTKLGFNITLMGKYGYIKSQNKLNLTTDLDIATDRDATLHMGAEYWPNEMLALRAGIDQDPIPGGVSSNLTAGVGLRIGNVQFDYAYHTYYDIPENTTHFFSLSFVGPFDQRKPRSEFAVNLNEPKDSTTTYDGKVKLSGSIDDTRPGDKVLVDGKAVTIDKDGNFQANLSMKSLGSKRITVKATDAKGNVVDFNRDIFRVATFKDVPQTFWAKKPIELLATAGLVAGYPDGTFKPDKSLSRAELATLLVKAKGIPVPDNNRSPFSDVARDHWAANYIEAAVAAGLVKGYPDKTFRPDAKINRAEGVTVMARLEGLDEMASEMKDSAEDARFSDIVDSWAAGFIMAADSAGLLEYMANSETFSPSLGFTRGEAVEILSKTTLGGEKISNMLAGKGSEKTIEKLGAVE